METLEVVGIKEEIAPFSGVVAGVEIDTTECYQSVESNVFELKSLNEFYLNKVKKLPPSVVKDIELKNQARRLACLAPIKIKVRMCIACHQSFESAGNRTCGCNTRSTGFIAGREII